MKTGFLHLLALSGMLFGSLVMAEPLQATDSPDISYIKDWLRDQHAQELAAILGLSQEQIGEMRQIKQRVDQAKTEIEAVRQAFQTEMETQAAEIRTRLESTNQLTQQDIELMNNLRRKRRDMAKTTRLKLRLATVGLDSILDADQRNRVRSFVRQNRLEGEGRASNPGKRGERRGARHDRHNRNGKRGGGNGAGMPRQLARVLLSDAFLAYYSTH